MRLRQSALLLLLVAAFLGSALLAWPGRPAAAGGLPGNAVESAPRAAGMLPVLPAPARPIVAAPAAAPDPRALALPDGSSVPALNGTENAPPLVLFWSPQRPWSPIVGVERNDQGVDWYAHADGSYSTTEMKWRSDLGRMDAMTRVAHPGDGPVPPARR